MLAITDNEILFLKVVPDIFDHILKLFLLVGKGSCRKTKVCFLREMMEQSAGQKIDLGQCMKLGMPSGPEPWTVPDKYWQKQERMERKTA